MDLLALSLENLAKLDDGRIAETYKQALERVVRDCEDRPGETKARTVNLQLEVVPVMDADDEGTPRVFPQFALQVKETIPTRKSKRYTGEFKAGGQIAFSALDPTNPNQRHLEFGDDEAEPHIVDQPPGE